MICVLFKGNGVTKIASIYLITNITNSKKYVGVTTKANPNKRWTEHKAFSRDSSSPRHYVLHQAINKHGIDSFTFEVIYRSHDANHTVDVMEPFFIKEYDTFGPNGYNLTPGGRCPMLGRTHTEETRLKISQNRRGIGHSEEAKKRISSSTKGIAKSEKHRTNISAFRKGGDNYRSKNWIVVRPDGQELQITNMKNFCRTNNLHPGRMTEVAQGKLEHHKGYRCSKT